MVNLDYLYNPAAAKEIFAKNFFVDRKSGFSVIENGTVLPHKSDIPGQGIWGGGGIVDGNGEYISNSFVHYGWGTAYTPHPMQFNVVLKLLFIWDSFFPCGDMYLPITFAASGS